MHSQHAECEIWCFSGVDEYTHWCGSDQLIYSEFCEGCVSQKEHQNAMRLLMDSKMVISEINTLAERDSSTLTRAEKSVVAELQRKCLKYFQTNLIRF